MCTYEEEVYLCVGMYVCTGIHTPAKSQSVNMMWADSHVHTQSRSRNFILEIKIVSRLSAVWLTKVFTIAWALAASYLETKWGD